MTVYVLNLCLVLLLALALYRRFILRPQIWDLERRVRLPEFEGTARLVMFRACLSRLQRVRDRLRPLMLALAMLALLLMLRVRSA